MTLEDAFKQAYAHNPLLDASRARARAAQKGIPIARSGFFPKLKFVGSVGSSKSVWVDGMPFGASAETLSFPRSAELKIEQTLFDGGRTLGALKMAEAETAKAQALVLGTEQSVLLDVAKAYVNVLRDQKLLKLYKSYVSLTEEHLKSLRTRSFVGEATITDVAQTEAALSEARALLLEMEANYQVSCAAYVKVVGVTPTTLVDIKKVPSALPLTPEGALEKGMAHHPEIKAASESLHVAYGKEVAAKSDFAPSLTLSASLVYGHSFNNPNDTKKFGTVSGHLVMPLFDGGLASARTHQAREEISQARYSLQAVHDEINAMIYSSWIQYDSLVKKEDLERNRVAANKRAFEGTEEEERAGQRLLLDTLNARRELLKAESALITVGAQKNVAAYALLSAMGEFSIERVVESQKQDTSLPKKRAKQ